MQCGSLSFLMIIFYQNCHKFISHLFWDHIGIVCDHIGGKASTSVGPGGVGGGGKQLPTAPDSVGAEDNGPEAKAGGERGGAQTGGAAAAKTPKSKGKVGDKR